VERIGMRGENWPAVRDWRRSESSASSAIATRRCSWMARRASRWSGAFWPSATRLAAV